MNETASTQNKLDGTRRLLNMPTQPRADARSRSWRSAVPRNLHVELYERRAQIKADKIRPRMAREKRLAVEHIVLDTVNLRAKLVYVQMGWRKR